MKEIFTQYSLTVFSGKGWTCAYEVPENRNGSNLACSFIYIFLLLGTYQSWPCSRVMALLWDQCFQMTQGCIQTVTFLCFCMSNEFLRLFSSQGGSFYPPFPVILSPIFAEVWLAFLNCCYPVDWKLIFYVEAITLLLSTLLRVLRDIFYIPPIRFQSHQLRLFSYYSDHYF